MLLIALVMKPTKETANNKALKEEEITKHKLKNNNLLTMILLEE